MNRALVVFSGGQDSTTCLFQALGEFEQVATIGFAYGQRHEVELDCRREILAAIPAQFPQYAGKLLPDTLLDITAFGSLTVNALTGEAPIAADSGGLPTTFVPGRNLVFLCYAAARAYALDCGTIITGAGEADYSGYPDCREETMRALERAISLGLGRAMRISTPLMHLTKAATWALAEQLGGRPLVDFIRKHTHTCYNGDREHWHDWGYGCGECPACVLRRNGWKAYNI